MYALGATKASAASSAVKKLQTALPQWAWTDPGNSGVYDEQTHKALIEAMQDQSTQGVASGATPACVADCTAKNRACADCLLMFLTFHGKASEMNLTTAEIGEIVAAYKRFAGITDIVKPPPPARTGSGTWLKILFSVVGAGIGIGLVSLKR